MLHRYRIADLIVEMDSFGRTVDRAIPYLCCEELPIDIKISTRSEQFKRRHPSITEDDAEYLGAGLSFYLQLLRFNGLMLHASAVVVDGKAYLFSAHSGTGKSTHANLWMQLFGERAYILNDDKPALRLIDGVWYAFGTPWSGKNNLSVNKGIPLAGIAMVERNVVNGITRHGGFEAISEIYEQTNRPKSMELRIILLELLDKLMTQVPVWKLKCNMDPEAAIVSYEAMSGEKWRKI